VGEHIRIGVEHGVDVLGLALEVAGQDLERHVRAGRLDAADGLGPVRRAAVGQVVAVDAGDHRVLEAELGQGLGHAARLVRIRGQGTPGRHVAEAARAGADVAQDHDGQRAPAPALADVGAAGALADRVQPLLAHQPLHLEEGRLGRQADLDPLGMPPPARPRRRRRLWLADDRQRYATRRHGDEIEPRSREGREGKNQKPLSSRSSRLRGSFDLRCGSPCRTRPRRLP
jgi:hypothetical protein